MEERFIYDMLDRLTGVISFDKVRFVRQDYVGNCEYVRANGVVTSERTYLSGPLGVFAVIESQSQPTGRGTYYVHPDHLGSWTTVTDGRGRVVQDVRFDPWGTAYYSDSTHLVQASSLLFDRGFTGHEHMTHVGLINMNGRVYDPILGRMLSPDVLIQDEQSSQAYNRYCYCFNNPLRFTDPSGWALAKYGNNYWETGNK